MGRRMKPPRSAPDCLKCVYFSVSWDPRFPRTCKVFEIKSARMPSYEVFKSTGHHCPCFRISPKVKAKSEGTGPNGSAVKPPHGRRADYEV
jgi:hypothetical protein